MQKPIPAGEGGLTYHFRNAKFVKSNLQQFDTLKIPEHRLGLDAKFDIEIGLWFEAVQISKTKKIGLITNQSLLNIGADYTFPVGNGLYVALEELFVSYNETLGEFKNNLNFTAISANYPIGMNDNLSLITYYDWKNRNSYNFINWKHTYDPLQLYLMDFGTPKNTFYLNRARVVQCLPDMVCK